MSDQDPQVTENRAPPAVEREEVGGEILRKVLQNLRHACAVVDFDEWCILFENATFFQWFPAGGEGDGLLGDRLPGFKAERAHERLSNGRPMTYETEAKITGREIPIEVDIRPLPGEQQSIGIVECRDLSKQRQAEYMLESYSNMAEKNARDLQREKERVEKLLLNIMPRSVYEEMKDYGTVTPQRFDNASIVLLDFVDFTEMAVSREPSNLISELNDIFTSFDRIVELFGCERIKTIGDAYMAVSGLPEENPEHAQNAARAALRMRRYIERRNTAHTEAWRCRIGVHSGPVVGSIVGIQKYVYDIFGPGVNMAARMEVQSDPMQITVSEATYDLIKDEFRLEERGEFEVKGFGKQRLYSLISELPTGR
jgi:class 3 adenylate cyclase